MVADFDSTVRTICNFIEIGWSTEMRDFSHAADGTIEVNAQSGKEVRQGLKTGLTGQWQRYKHQLAPILPILQPWVERFGYPAD
jgi:hypothetical protein